MTAEEWADALFTRVAGWLGWTPDVILETPIPLLLMALEGRAEYVKVSSPFGGGGKDQPPRRGEKITTPEGIKAFLQNVRPNPGLKK